MTAHPQLALGKIATLARRGIRKAIQLLGACANPPLCENIVLWAAARGWSMTLVHAPFVLDFPVPAELQPFPRLAAQFEGNRRLGFPGQHLIGIPRARVQGSTGFVVLEEGAYLTEGHWRVANVVNHPLYRKEWPLPKKRRLAGDWYCAMGHWGSNYNHWLWDEIPRLLSALPYLPADTQFLVPEPLSAMQRDSLAALGIARERLVAQGFDCESVVERLWFATPLGHSEWAASAADVVVRLRKAFLGAFGIVPSKEDRRVYVSRSLSQYRRLVNESELLPQFASFGFDVVHAEELTFEQQIRAFSAARVIAGVHGAGLTNMLFCPPESVVLEVHGPQVTRAHYWMMAHTLGHEYRCLVGDPVSPSTNGGTEPDLHVSRETFSRFLEESLDRVD